ncbi:MAG TPA: DUF4440 domain-containing protein [Pyrinomonadaceae bacterium]|nr:DUF4440 domain-containing protein [Pyrinomonadaceae bacterium]
MRLNFDNQAMYLYFVHAMSLLVPRQARLDWRREWEAEIVNHLRVLQKRNRLNLKSKVDLWAKVAGASFDVAMFENNRTRFVLIGLNSLVAVTMGSAAVQEFSIRDVRGGQLQPFFLSSAVIIVSVLFIISAVAILRESSAERSLVIITGVLSIVVHVYGTLPPHGNMGYLALLIGAGYGLVMILIYQRMKFILLVAFVIASPVSIISQTPRPEAEVLRTEQEQREAYLKRDIAKTERLVADEFIFTSGRNVGDKASLLDFLKTTAVDPTLTLTAEDTRVAVDGDTAIVIGRRVERRRREDNNREGVAYARYVRTYIKRQERWQLLAEHLETIPAERTAVKIDAKIYDDYVGEYESPIFDFAVIKDGERLMAVPKERTTTRTSQGRPPGELLPESEAEFFLRGRDAQVIFMRNRKGEVTHAIMRINGADIRATRRK